MVIFFFDYFSWCAFEVFSFYFVWVWHFVCMCLCIEMSKDVSCVHRLGFVFSDKQRLDALHILR